MLLDWKNIVKMTKLPKANYSFNANPIKLPVAFFHRIRTKFYNFLRKKNGTGGINCLTSGSTTKPQSSRQYGTGTKTEI